MYSYRVLANPIHPRPEAAPSAPAGLARPQAPLDRFYYLKNFESVLSTILERYADLLSERESRFITEFTQITQCSRALLARMVMRRGDLFRASKLNYPEIGDTRAAAAPLIEAGFVTDRAVLSVAQLQGLFT